MPFVNRFSEKLSGGIILIGNTLGISKKEQELLVGTHHSVGAYITTNEASFYEDFGPGTTGDYTLNCSSGYLSLPEGTMITYAELIWSGCSQFSFGEKVYSIHENVNDSVLIWSPKKKEYEIIPDEDTRFLLSSWFEPKNQFYIRSANVTNIMKEEGTGEYIVGRVPSILVKENPNSFVGWTLAVVYEQMNKDVYMNRKQNDMRQINLLIGGHLAEYQQSDEKVMIKGKIPKKSNRSSTLSFSASMGGWDTYGSEIYLKSEQNDSSLVLVSGANNLPHHFFAGQINNQNGELDTRGTRGNWNHKLNDQKTAYAGIIGARQGWDITTIDISNCVDPLSEELSIIFHTEGSSYIVNTLALDIEVIEEKVMIKKDYFTHSIKENDEIVVTLTVINEGNYLLKDAYITDSLIEGMKLKEDDLWIASVSNHRDMNKDNAIIFKEIHIPVGDLVPISQGGLPTVVSYKLMVESLERITDYKSYATVHYYIEELNQRKSKNSNNATLLKEMDSIIITMEKVSQSEDERDSIKIKETITNATFGVLTNLVILHTLTEGATYEKDVYLNGVKTSYDLNSGIMVEELKAKESCILEYSIKFEKENENNEVFLDQVNVTGIYKDEEEGFLVHLRGYNQTQLKTTYPKLEVDKTSDKLIIGKTGEKIRFTLTITNTGNVSMEHITLSDRIQEGMEYLKKSTKINNGQYFDGNPEKGITIEKLEPEEICVIHYQVTLKK